MINLRSCLFLACLVSTFGSVFPNPIGSSLEEDSRGDDSTTWTQTGERVDGDKLVIDEEIVVLSKDQENTFYMPKGDEFTAVEIWYPERVPIEMEFPGIRYKYTVKLRPFTIPTKGLKYKIKVYAKPIVCPDGTESCKKFIDFIRLADRADDEKKKLNSEVYQSM
ncbi:hypothetical protein QAD02_010001 [Eretmocerus hayati]|uniref:Uncharacterized protein n=1 Tax=Eretmocerus hayati TaxID=131215 RepID=A0ACC2NBL3_9HYME|nr:hypothetical protein QAD02_010001 [Eretmocerus hayati]